MNGFLLACNNFSRDFWYLRKLLFHEYKDILTEKLRIRLPNDEDVVGLDGHRTGRR